jgi:hypothetical protein
MGQKPSEDKIVRAMLQTTRIIVGALMAGVLSFAGFLLFTNLANAAPRQPLLAYIGIGFAVLVVVPTVLVPKLVTTQQIRQIAAGTWKAPPAARARWADDADTDVARLAQVYQLRTIIASALPEATAFLNLVAYQIEGQFFSLLIAAGLLLLIAAHFPRTDAVNNWMQDRLRDLEDLRQLKD